MSFITSYFDSVAKDEDDELVNYIRKLYGPALEISFTFPLWRSSNRPFTLAVLICYATMFPIHFYVLSISIACVRDDFNLTSMEFHYWLLLLFSIISIIVINANRDNMIQIHRVMINKLGRYGMSNLIYREDYPMQLVKKQYKQLLQFLLLPIFVLAIAGLALLIPYVKNMDGKVHYNSRGANMKLPIAAWYPFPSHEGILGIIVVLGQFITGGGLSAVIAALDLLIFRLTQAVILEYKVLRYALRTLMSRSKLMYVKHHQRARHERIDYLKNNNFQHCLGNCIKECIIHHHNISKYMGVYKMLVKWPAFLAYGFGTGVIGLSLINILEAKKAEKYEDIAIFVALSVCEVLNMFLISYLSEAITTESKELREELYFVEWHKMNTSNRKLLVNFQVGLNDPVVIKLGGLVNANLDTFSSIINTSYSFFNLVNAQA